MISLFRRRPERAAPPPPLNHPPRLPDGVRIYVFGDLHGRDDLAVRLQDAIAADRELSGLPNTVVVGLGDMIDRGSGSQTVIQIMVGGFTGCTTVCLRGNHEQMLIDFLEDPVRYGPLWFRNGAIETLRSYGIATSGRERPPAEELREIRDAAARAIPPSHLLFLQRMPLSYTAGDYFFAHAGAKPGVALTEQTPMDLLWIRSGFADRDPPFEKVVVHGHTPVDQPYFGLYRINLDTGAYSTGRLTCLALEGDQRRLLPV